MKWLDSEMDAARTEMVAGMRAAIERMGGAEALRRFLELEPKTGLLVNCEVQGWNRGEVETRGYWVEKILTFNNMYLSSMSGGDHRWTDEDQGPDGEPIVAHRNWCVRTPEGGCITDFETWEEVALFFLFQLRVKVLDFVKD